MMKTSSRVFAVLCSVLLLLVVAPPAHAQAPHMAPTRADTGMVVSARAEASEAGVAMLKQGGNAVDAAVATGFALAVVYPRAGNIGGGGFMVVRTDDGAETTIDYREKAPMEATRTMYQDASGEVVSQRSREGYLASGVPGSVAGLLKALEEHGTLTRAQVMAPAIRLAEEGFRLSQRQANSFNGRYETFAQYPGSERYFTKGSEDRYYEAGELFVQEDLAAVLKRIRDQGRAGFYQGETAELIVEEMERGGGLISHADLQDYQAVEREPVRANYRGYNIISMGPPSSGGVALAQLFNAVEPYDIAEMGYQSSAAVHLMGEAMRRVYADRAKWLGDSDFFDVPMSGLTDPAYMQQRMQSFDPDATTPTETIDHGNPLAFESTETTHYSVVDGDGNAVSVTTTLNGSYGSKVVVDGAGFFLNNEMDDFSAKPGVPNMYGLVGSEANAIEPEKRMLSSMSPTIVEDPDGELFMVIGTPGGSTIITTVFQVILNVIDHGMNIQEAVAAPRVHHQWKPNNLWYERFGLAADAVQNLEDRGWSVREGSAWGGTTWGQAEGITVRAEPVAPGANAMERVLYGGADPRGNDTAVGY
jgi:gamma-glutamyltranspeptidase/glutathione hydrolase